ncbi:trans-2,3-dihydro-3-hydroxyanthranilate isomerase [Fictibacillus enclensis]|uniref:Phenazine biosynthesis protein PhzF n=1 Tax=Fictibacillus enclensis TaxID=1017270 RepID=A0A0V8JA24_9BACL|nr:PhzF family phenazine biosynthesis protein [Fictibacillus enclensis]KSU84034.1 phenazine biosynthesis protein PhzF [Fictibacillus enclensis]SCB72123.1 trans-2,3-dihydro-3-hydroxyanthranilate isomerase [Fictibacillus enclensis]
MKSLTYTLLDVFTNKPFSGNQLAVFQDNVQLSTEWMQKIARELNLSETVFVQSPDNRKNNKKLRIFTPEMELPMAGHPTLGAAFLLAQKGWIATSEGRNEWIFEEGVGDISVTVHKGSGDDLRIEMNQPMPQFGPSFQERELAATLLSLSPEDLDVDLPIQTVSTGVPFLFIPVQSLEAMKSINFRMDIWEKDFSHNPSTRHIFAFTAETEEEESTVHSRMFAPAMGIPEDPATGAASGPLGAYIVEHMNIVQGHEGIYQLRSEQGFEMGRRSLIDITIQKDAEYKEVIIGGKSVIVGSGELFLDL